MTDWQNILDDEAEQMLGPRDTNNASTSPADGVQVTVEALAYALLALLVAGMFLLRLGIIPLTADEVPRALAAWQAIQPNSDPISLPDSALIQLGHLMVLATLGSSEAVLRLPTALAGMALVFSPVLFRSMFGRARVFVMCVLLAASPVVLAGSRLDSPVIWEMLLTVISLWTVWRYLVTRQAAFAYSATVLLITVGLMAGPTGHVAVITILLAFALAERLLPPDADVGSVGQHLHAWPWRVGIGFGALAVVVVSTLFMTYPAGLNAVGSGFGEGVRGWVGTVPNAPLFFAASASLLYEPILWIFGIVGVVIIARHDKPAYPDLFLLAWAAIAALMALLYAGSTAANALWLTVPLVGLVSGVAVHLLVDEDGWLWFSESDRVTNLFGLSVPGWSRWVVAGATAGILMLALMHVGELARTIQIMPVNNGWNSAITQLAPSGVILLILLLLLVFMGFTVASAWGSVATLRGGAVGLLAVGVVAMLGTGWQITYNRAHDPRELWHTVAYGEDVVLLRETLIELAERETGGFKSLDVFVVTDGAAIAEDGMLAWITRDFPNTRFVRHEADARAQEVVLTRLMPEAPSLGGNYLGQSFTLRRTWSTDTLTAREFPAWWFQRATRTPPEVAQTVVLWLRQDLYEGVDVPGLE
jgi:hypothetical protein